MTRKDLDRRTFLKKAGAAGAGAAMGLGERDSRASEATESTAPWEAHKAPYVHQQIPDVVIVGAGVFGIFNAYYLRRMGVEVTVVDLYGPGNSRSTSGGETRGVRSSYGERPANGQWTRWAKKTIGRWAELNEQWKHLLVGPLFYQTGDLILRDETSPYLEDTQKWWDTFGIEYEVLDASEVKYRWPVIDIENVAIALHEPGAGVVRARRSIETVSKVFQDDGGKLIIAHARPGGREGNRQWDIELTPGGRLRAGQFVWALGPWFPKAFPELLGGRINASMIGHTVYFATPPGDNRFTFPNLPSYGVPGCTGWPALPPDHRGFRVRSGGRQGNDPDISPRRLDAEHIEGPRRILREWFPALGDAPVSETRACHYCQGAGRNFIIDRQPQMENVWITGAGNAEAFKQGPVLGEYIARRVMGLETDPEDDEAFKFPEQEFDPERGRGRGGRGGRGRGGDGRGSGRGRVGV